MRRDQLLAYFTFVLLALLILWLELYAIPLAVIWLIARWRKATWTERIFAIAGFAAIFAVAHFTGESVQEKMDRTIIIFILALMAPVVSRFTRRREP